MTHSINRNRSQLEQVWNQPSVSRTFDTVQPTALSQPSSSILPAGIIRQIISEFVTFFTGAQQLRIWTKSTKQGVVWFAYDPQSDQRIANCSETELRTWLETRHHS